ncbi:MAG: NifU family protein [Mycobacterium sp.]
MIGIHAERVVGDDRVVRWVVPAGTLPVGRVRVAPGRFGEMLRDGTISDALSEHTAVWLWLRDGLSWATSGRAVQAALREALVDPGAWVVEPAPGEVLEHVTADLLAGSVGDFVRSHGGSVTARPAGGDAVAVQLGGACEHCAAAEFTLRARLLGELRRRCPDLVEVDRGGGGLTVTLGG